MNNEQVSKLIERIIYLSSLASRRQDVAEFTDTLSMITSRWKNDQEMPENDQKELQELENELKIYLVTKDPLRSFTLETLERRINDKSSRIRTPTISEFGGIIIGSFLAGIIAFALSFSTDIQSRALLCVAVFFIALHIGIAWLYISALKYFRSTFRQTYVYLSIAAVLLSVGFTHFAVINLFQLDRHPIFQYGGVTWLIALPFVFMFLGLRQYATVLQIKSIFTSIALAGCVVVAIAILLLVLPKPSVNEPLYFHIWSIGVWAIPLFALLSSALASKIKKTVTSVYAKSMDWLYYYTLVVGLGSILSGSVMYASGELYGERLAAVIALCGIAPQLVLLYAAYSFKKETSK
jgi:hypothetical protein